MNRKYDEPKSIPERDDAAAVAKALVAPGLMRRSLREIAEELKAQRFQNRDGTPFSGSAVARMPKINDARQLR